MKYLRAFNENFSPVGTLVPQILDILLDVEDHGFKLKVKKLYDHNKSDHMHPYYLVNIEHPDFNDDINVGGTFNWIEIKDRVHQLIDFMISKGGNKYVITYNLLDRNMDSDGNQTSDVTKIPDDEIVESYMEIRFE